MEDTSAGDDKTRELEIKQEYIERQHEFEELNAVKIIISMAKKSVRVH